MTKFRHNHLIALLDAMFTSGTGALSGNFIGLNNNKIDAANLSFFNAAQVIEGQNVLGERGDQLTTIAMHSAVRNHLVHMGMLTFSSPAGAPHPVLPLFGVAVVLASLMRASNTSLVCALLLTIV